MRCLLGHDYVFAGYSIFGYHLTASARCSRCSKGRVVEQEYCVEGNGKEGDLSLFAAGIVGARIKDE